MMLRSLSFRGETGGMGPEASPRETRVPPMRIILRSASNLRSACPITLPFVEPAENVTHVSLSIPSKMASTPSPTVSSGTRAAMASVLV